MIDVYICHEYDDKSHFNAIYKCAQRHGYRIVSYTVLENMHLIRRFIKAIIVNNDTFGAFRGLMNGFKNKKAFRKLEGELIIVGIAPYNRIMNKYSTVFSKNKCIYFTSWQHWNEDRCPRGYVKNKERFINTLKTCFRTAACVSQTTQNEIGYIFDKSEVVNHSVTVEDYVKKNTEDYSNNDYIFLGRLDENKNIPLILEYMRTNNSLDIEMYFAGDGPLKKEVIDAARSDSRIHYLGVMKKMDIKKQLHMYKFLILPSIEEAFGIVLIEALSAGVPCVISNALGPKEIIDEHTGFVFSLEDGLKGFSLAMEKSINLSLNDYRIMSNNCLKYSKKYSEEYVFEKWNNLFEYTLTCSDTVQH